MVGGGRGQREIETRRERRDEEADPESPSPVSARFDDGNGRELSSHLIEGR